MSLPRSPAGAAAQRRVVPVRELFEQHYLAMVRIAYSVVGDRESAEDVVQDVFATLQKRDRAAGLTEPRHYLTVAVLNRSRSVLRRRRLLRRAGPARVEHEEAADESTIRRVESDRVLAAVRRLPTRQREVVVLRFLEDLAVREIARVLGITPAAASSSLNRAMSTLRQRLGSPDER
ncbi:sigma-70 family RNA polymerase sigma factor [Solihabitans fulvus]|uniref:Sigma-70 family RNA polymerase sigma factor n=1 Tax=Solihabitans fulvus TaxID=1892852 RepID=A0A5B2XI15_9PSEU|nr:sigma-70 family RNA polymerase sigma factor [Solihabitans fulvus]KAA2262629.1 sigma-70 family RNA polymerase sigma factor [Solihabitans fulvus]